MVLMGIQKEQGWVISRWSLIYKTGWENMLRAINLVYDHYDKMEILVDGKPQTIEDKKDILEIPEAGNITFRGMSKLLKAPIMITFYNQLEAVDMHLLMSKDKYEVVDYQKFNILTCAYMDSLELYMN